MTEISDDAKRNREGWTQTNTEFTDAQASKSWAAAEITWGVFGVPEESYAEMFIAERSTTSIFKSFATKSTSCPVLPWRRELANGVIVLCMDSGLYHIEPGAPI